MLRFPSQLFSTKTVFTIGSILYVKAYVVDIAVNWGASMLPTLNISNDICVVVRLNLMKDRISYTLFHKLDIGEVIVCKSPIDPTRSVVKRVLGLPGDVVIKDPLTGLENIEIPKGHVWLSGDNMSNSRDSRDYGPVSMGLIEGKVILKVQLMLPSYGRN